MVSDSNVPTSQPARLELPENEFRYNAGPKERPWYHFTGRWQAIQPRLQQICDSLASNRPIRIIDLGSCTGFFALQAAYQHANADVIGVEGSVGIGNGAVGMEGNMRRILATSAVQTHLRWIKRLNLANCLIAPEVWDYVRIMELASQKRPICDVMFSLSVIHHIDGVSTQQFTNAGLSRCQGIISTIVALLSLAPAHFVELPNQPWLQTAYDVYGSQRGIIEAAMKASNYEWELIGPLYNAEWFGPRDLWLVQVKGGMDTVDLNSNPFRQLFGGEEATRELWEDDDVPPAHASVLNSMPPNGVGGTRAGTDDSGIVLLSAAGGLADPLLDHSASMQTDLGYHTMGHYCQSGIMMDPSMTAMCMEPPGAVDPNIVALIQKAPAPLLAAHLTLREAISEAEALLREVAATGFLKDERSARRLGMPGPDNGIAVQEGGAGINRPQRVQ